ncbi:unnamed protein product [Prorocentrum cordatum]|uniref:Uncharacterized protein n=1 Tax=Prorocentrum cordatum TaxID=2364126 RepID=A0ABN9TL97_9DINO|nr:unnamed protein product [Polarella glacialis]
MAARSLAALRLAADSASSSMASLPAPWPGARFSVRIEFFSPEAGAGTRSSGMCVAKDPAKYARCAEALREAVVGQFDGEVSVSLVSVTAPYALEVAVVAVADGPAHPAPALVFSKLESKGWPQTERVLATLKHFCQLPVRLALCRARGDAPPSPGPDGDLAGARGPGGAPGAGLGAQLPPIGPLAHRAAVIRHLSSGESVQVVADADGLAEVVLFPGVFAVELAKDGSLDELVPRELTLPAVFAARQQALQARPRRRCLLSLLDQHGRAPAEAKTGSSSKEKKLKQDGKAQAEDEETLQIESEEADEELDMKSMMKRMMSMANQTRSDMRKSKEDTEEIKTVANQAKATASMVEQTVEIVRGEVNQIRESAVNKEDLPKRVQEIVQAEGLTTGSSMKEGVGKTEKRGAFSKLSSKWSLRADISAAKGMGKGKEGTEVEKRFRTVYLGNFPEDANNDIIKGHVKEWTKHIEYDVDDIFAFGKFAIRGAVRSKTEEAMWKYFAETWGKLQHEVMGETIYANLDSLRDSNPSKTKAVRKVVRTIIESNPGNGDDIKKSIDPDYGQGIVWWNDRRVAEWKEKEGEGKMKLFGAAEQYQEKF